MTLVRKPVSVTVNGIEIRAVFSSLRQDPNGLRYVFIAKINHGMSYGYWNGKRLTRAAALNEAEVTALERALRKAKP